MWILMLIILIIVNCIITLISISQVQKAILESWKIQDKCNDIFTRNIIEIHNKLKTKEAVSSKEENL